MSSEVAPDATIEWTDLDRRAVDTVRVLAMDAVQKVGNGHPGTAMSLAPATYLLWQRFLRHDPSDPDWVGRDRFVLSLRALQPHALHPALPVGLRPDARRPQGASAPGAAGHRGTPSTATPRASRRRPGRSVRASATPSAWRWPRAASAGSSTPTPHPARASSTTPSGASPPTATSRRASPPRPPRSPAPSASATSCLVWDDNHISIEGDTVDRLQRGRRGPLRGATAGTSSSSTGSAGRRHRRPGPGRRLRRRPRRDRAAPRSSASAPSSPGRPRPCRTPTRPTVARSAPTRSRRRKVILGFDPEQTFQVDADVLAHAREVGDRGRELHADLGEGLRGLAYVAAGARRPARPAARAPAPRRLGGRAPRLRGVARRAWPPAGLVRRGALRPRPGPPRAVRRLGRPGRARTTPRSPSSTSFLPGIPDGRQVHFGIREHAMGSIHERDRAARRAPPVRRHVPRLQRLHASGGPARGADEAARHLRVDPRLDRPRRGRPDPPAGRAPRGAAGHPRPRRRPAGRRQRDRAVAWRTILAPHRPTRPGCACSRQNVPTSTATVYASAEGVARGGYVLAEATGGDPQVILIGTGSEVAASPSRPARDARGRRHPDPRRLDALHGVVRRAGRGLPRRGPPPRLKARVSVEAGIALGWREYRR